MIEKTVCELFAGVGGFRLGLEESGDESESNQWKTVWANQWEPGKIVQHAFDCYVKNFGQSPYHENRDISLINKEEIPDHNLLVGGFPCQDYSVASTGAKGIAGKKGVLWWQIRDLIEAKKPKFVLLENVDRLLKSPANQRGRDFGVMLWCLKELGYNVEWRVLNAAEYGFAQRRRRVFIFAYRKTTQYNAGISKMTKLELLEKEGFFARTFPVKSVDKKVQVSMEYSDIVQLSDTFKFGFENSGIMGDGIVLTAKVCAQEVLPIPMREILVDDAEEKYYLGDSLEKWERLKGAKKILRTSKEGFQYIFAEGAIPFPDSIDRPARTMLTSESSVNRSTHVIQDPKTGRLRLITPIEAERIQGFKDDWTKTDTMPEKFRYFCMGNALVVGLVTKMGNTLNEIFENEK